MSKNKKKMQHRRISPQSKIELITAFVNLIIALINIIAIMKIQN